MINHRSGLLALSLHCSLALLGSYQCIAQDQSMPAPNEPTPPPMRFTPDTYRRLAEQGHPSSILTINNQYVSTDPLDRAVLDRLIFGQQSKENTAQLLAFVQTFYNSRSFQNSSDALSYMRERVDYYKSIDDPKEMSSLIEGVLDSGVGIGYGIANRDISSLLSSGIDVFGLAREGLNAASARSRDESIELLRQNIDSLRVQVALQPNTASPLLRYLITGKEDASDAEYKIAYDQMIATTGAVSEAAERVSGLVGEQYKKLIIRMEELLALQSRRIREGATKEEIENIEQKITEISGLIRDLTNAVSDMESVIRRQQAPASSELIGKFNHLISITRSIGTILNLPAKELEDGISVVTSGFAVVLAAAPGDPIAFIAAGLNFVRLIFGDFDGGPDPHALILQEIAVLRRDINIQFNDIRLRLRDLGVQVDDLRKEIGERFDSVDASLRSMRSEILYSKQATLKGFRDLTDLITALQARDVNVDWVTLLSALEAFEESFYAAKAVQITGGSQEAEQNALVSAKNALNASFNRFLVNARFDKTGFGYPSAEIAGSVSCLDDAVESMYRSTDLRSALKERATVLAGLFEAPDYGHKAYCVASVIQYALGSLPRFRVPANSRNTLSRLPGEIVDDRFVPWNDPVVFSPVHLWQFMVRMRDVVNQIPDNDLRRKELARLIESLKPGLKMLQLTGSREGNELLVASYYALAAELVEDVNDIFYNDYMENVAEYERWKRTRLQAIGNVDALNNDSVYWDQFEGQLVGLPELDPSILSVLEANQASFIQTPYAEFYRKLASFRLNQRKERRAQLQQDESAAFHSLGGPSGGSPQLTDRMHQLRAEFLREKASEFLGIVSEFAANESSLTARFDAGLSLFLQDKPSARLSGDLDHQLDIFLQRGMSALALEALLNKRLLRSSIYHGSDPGNKIVDSNEVVVRLNFSEGILPFLEMALEARAGRRTLSSSILSSLKLEIRKGAPDFAAWKAVAVAFAPGNGDYYHNHMATTFSRAFPAAGDNVKNLRTTYSFYGCVNDASLLQGRPVYITTINCPTPYRSCCPRSSVYVSPLQYPAPLPSWLAAQESFNPPSGPGGEYVWDYTLTPDAVRNSVEVMRGASFSPDFTEHSLFAGDSEASSTAIISHSHALATRWGSGDIAESTNRSKIAACVQAASSRTPFRDLADASAGVTLSLADYYCSLAPALEETLAIISQAPVLSANAIPFNESISGEFNSLQVDYLKLDSARELLRGVEQNFRRENFARFTEKQVAAWYRRER